jgi:hypothetical protein
VSAWAGGENSGFYSRNPREGPDQPGHPLISFCRANQDFPRASIADLTGRPTQFSGPVQICVLTIYLVADHSRACTAVNANTELSFSYRKVTGINEPGNENGQVARMRAVIMPVRINRILSNSYAFALRLPNQQICEIHSVRV